MELLIDKSLDIVLTFIFEIVLITSVVLLTAVSLDIAFKINNWFKNK